MSVRLANRSRQLVIVTLNSGDTIHLAPNEISRPIEDFEVKDNNQIANLLKANQIASLSGQDAESVA